MSSTAKNLYDQLWALPEEERLQIRRALNQGRTVLEFRQNDKAAEEPKPWTPTAEDRAKSARATESLLATAGFLKDAPPFDFENPDADPNEG